MCFVEQLDHKSLHEIRPLSSQDGLRYQMPPSLVRKHGGVVELWQAEHLAGTVAEEAGVYGYSRRDGCDGCGQGGDGCGQGGDGRGQGGYGRGREARDGWGGAVLENLEDVARSHALRLLFV